MLSKSNKKQPFSWLPAALLFFFLIIAFLGIYYVWNRYALSQAINLFAEEEYEASIKHSERLIWFGYKKKLAEGLRARALAEIDPETAISELSELVSKRGPKFDHRVTLSFIELLVRKNKFEEAKHHLDELADLGGSSPQYMLLRAKTQFADREFSESYDTLRTLLKVEPNHAEGNLSYATFLLNSDDPINEIPAKVSLRTAGNSDDSHGLRALAMLATNPRIPLFPDDREWLANRLREHPDANAQTRILAATQELIFNGEQSDTIIDQAIASEGNKDPEMIVNWLLQIGQSGKALDFVNEGAGDTLPVALSAQVRLQALLMQNDFEGVRKLLSDEESQFPKLLRETVLAIVDIALATEATGAPTEQWRKAHALALEQENTEAVLTLAQIAFRRGWLAEARESLEWALQESSNSVQTIRILRELVNVHYIEKNSRETLSTARRLLQLTPEAPQAQNNVYYLEALLEDPSDADPHRYIELVESNPEGLYHSGYAFALWKIGDFPAATNQFEALDERFLAVPASRLIGALLAFENQDAEEARKLISDLDKDQLLPEEAELLDGLIARLN